MCGIHSVSRITIRRAMDQLVREGIIERTRSRGTLTIPEAIAQWKRLRPGRVIQLLTDQNQAWDTPDSYYSLIRQGILLRSEQAGYRLAVQHINVARTSTPMDLQLPARETTLGVMFVGLMNETVVQLYTEAGFPVVCVDYWTTNPHADAVVVDCYSEGQLAVEFLLRHGHTQLFFVGNRLGRQGVFERESDSELLLAGMQRMLVRAGLPAMPPEHIRFLAGEDADAREAVEWFLRLRSRPTAGVIFGTGLTDLFVHHLRPHGLRCPEDVSLITKAYEGIITDTTCLRGSAQHLGQIATDALLDRAAGRRQTAMRLVVPSVLQRGRTVRQLGLAAPRS